MKGPSHGRQIDVRRIWECPVCQKRIKTAGSVVNLRCEACARNKTGDTAWMRLIEPARRFRKPVPAEPVHEEPQDTKASELT
jgi:tRNA(Ile2) C34 agmatinyltransferase TiaS